MGNSAGRVIAPGDTQGFIRRHEKSRVTACMNQVDDGICHGMCLNWVRKMLVKGEDWKPKDGAPKTRYQQKGKAFHESFQQAVEARGDRRIGQLQADLHGMDAVFGRYEELVGLRKQRPLSDEEQRELAEKRQIVVAGKANRVQLAADIRAVKESLSTSGGWTAEYAGYFQEFKALGRRKFEQLEAQFHGALEIDSGGVADQFPDYFARIKVCINNMAPLTGALLNFYERQGKGHFVAFFRGGKNYHFYDPNFGWYRAQSLDEVGQFFEDAYIAAYSKKGYQVASWLSVTRQ